MILRIISHIHSTWSYDGTWSIPEIANTARRFGIHAILLSEHDKNFTQDKLNKLHEYCEGMRSNNLIIIPGIEYSDKTNTVHIIIVNPYIYYGENIDTDKLIELIKQNHDFAILAHPTRKEAWKSIKDEWFDVISGIEIWNRKEDGINYNRDAIVLMKKHDLLPVAALDFHKGKQFFPLYMNVRIDEGINIVSIINAFIKGNCTPVLLGIPIKYFYNTVIGRSILYTFEKLRFFFVIVIKMIKRS